MKRRFLALAMAMTMTAVAITGCSSSNGENTTGTEQNQEETENTTAQTAENETEAETSGQAGETGQKIKIAAIYRDMTQSWFIQESAAAEKMAQELGMEPLIIGDSKEDKHRKLM